MAKDGKDQKPNTRPSGNVTALALRCPVEGCDKKPKRMHFCDEHFEWFKAGLVTKQGEKPKDFDKKYAAFSRRKKAA